MTAKIIDGRAIAALYKAKVKARVSERQSQGLSTPGLAVILVGDNPASASYVRTKQRACQEVGIQSFVYHLKEETTQKELEQLIDQCNEDNAVHGILLQLPLPPHINTDELLERIRADKDVDGFHPYNMGRLVQRRPSLRPCTPYGVIKLLQSTQVKMAGKHAVVVGASNHVGRPMALELLLIKCTVTLCHRFTSDLAQQVEKADVLVVAVGKPGLVKSDWIKQGAIVIDVGFSRLANGKITGDVEFASASQRASWITPVPGGVGPMTVATLVENTLQATENLDS